MKFRYKAILVIFVILFSSCYMLDSHKRQDEDSYASYNSIEEAILVELNFVRTNPHKYAKDVLKPKLSSFKGNKYLQTNGIYLITNEGVSAVKEAINELVTCSAVNALSLDETLCKVSHLLARYQQQSGTVGHTGPNGMTMDKRIAQYGTWSGSIGENCAYGSKTAREIVSQLIIDDGVHGRGHRKNILSPDFHKVGIAYVEGENAPYGSVCVMDFASVFKAK